MCTPLIKKDKGVVKWNIKPNKTPFIPNVKIKC